VRPLLTAPKLLYDNRTLSYDDAVAATRYGLGAEAGWSPLSSALLALQLGHGEDLMEFADRVWGREVVGYPALQGATVAVACLDGPAPLPAAQAEAIAADAIVTA